MNRRFLRYAVAGLMLFSATTSPAAVIDKIAVVVNDEMITQGEIDRMVAPVYHHFATMYQGDELLAKLDEARQNIIAQLIEDRLILCEAKKLNVEVTESEIDTKVNEVIRRFESKDKFEKILADQKMSEKELRKRYREQLMVKKMIDQKVGARITITPVEISDFYNAHMSEFHQPEEVRYSMILIRLKEGSTPQKTLELAREISRRLKDGGDFSELAKIYSDGPNAETGGAMGFVKRGELMAEIEKVVFGLREGEVSDIVRTGLGYHFFRIDERREARNLTLAEARRQIEDAIFREEARQKLKGWIEDLRKKAYIAFK